MGGSKKLIPDSDGLSDVKKVSQMRTQSDQVVHLKWMNEHNLLTYRIDSRACDKRTDEGMLISFLIEKYLTVFYLYI